ncbi:SAM-dependent methyltransferase [Apilactobacillus xinyiensis]|uniref:SAM-dependent methyltransferase n=1 Tax=Apilactobacillus xinyiensis TaxID=2841032 RepID=UPI001C7D191E|nr:SAM-dependent methyltransferase [Apilactobacillus xinyiensis]
MDKRKLLKKLKKQHKITKAVPKYIERMENYQKIYADFPEIKFLINNIIEADRLISKNELPQDLPPLILADNIQDKIFEYVNSKYAPNDPQGDKLWNKLSNNLPKLDKDLRSFRDYLEAEYGMWAYISAPFIQDIAKYVDNKKGLEIMAGNGYISKGLRNLNKQIIATDSMEWVKENETGKHLLTQVEKIDALQAIEKYKNEIDYVIMCWSPDGVDIDAQVLNKLRSIDSEIELIVIGEKNGATNSKKFWEKAQFIENKQVIKLNQHHKPFDLIQDQLYLVK